MLEEKKGQIYRKLSEVEKLLNDLVASQRIYVDVRRYTYLVRKNEAGQSVWTDAIQAALNENEAVYFPKIAEPYYMDGTVVIPSGRHIKADPEAVIRQVEGVKVLMFRNEHIVDGTHQVPDTSERDVNISIIGGRWEESYRKRAGYGLSGMSDENRSFYGVSTNMLFVNVENLILKDMVFAHTAGFAVQTGELRNALFENIVFDQCYADGLHINGNSENLIIRNIRGQVGDDLVALNMYDWQNSSINFGPVKTVLCEELHSSVEPNSYKAMRIEPGTYFFDDGSQVDCSLEDAIIKNVSGIDTFKLYFQTPPYQIGENPEKGGVGSSNYLFFENIYMNLRQPADTFAEYMTGDPVRGTFACFELGADIGHISFENVHVNMYKEEFPMSFFLCIGPKSIVRKNREFFDPYISSTVKYIHTKDIFINDELVKDIRPYIHEIVFEDVNGDGCSSGMGKIQELIQI